LLSQPNAKKTLEKEQEMNLKNVWLTRAKECLTFAYGDEDEA